MKPNEDSYAENALKHGVSGLNIDGGRIEHNEPIIKTDRQKDKGQTWNKDNTGLRSNPTNIASASQKGRFPANIILDKEAAKILDEQSGVSKSGKPKGRGSKSGGIWQKSTGLPAGQEYGDKGGASRFFYVAKASKKERNRGLLGEPKNVSHDGRNKHIENPYQRHDNIQINYHPTVKPLKLMEYLCILTKTPTGGIVLDPFMGSGTTGMACKKIGRDFIGVEINKEYCDIAEKRIASIDDPI